MRTLELLAPAKNLECGIAAIDHGADAVYIGAQRFGARAAAGNSLKDIAALCKHAHQFGARVFVTVNTIIYDEELNDTVKLVEDLDKISVDAILIQDMGLYSILKGKNLHCHLHASTQTDNRSIDKVKWLESQGFNRVVLARELSINEINEIHNACPDTELEVFVHGALCVCYSGQCYASQHCFQRSANRGECAQFCRLAFTLKDAEGKILEEDRHLLSLRDMAQIDNMERLAEAGAVSFKIEGRLKDVDYVKNITAAYSNALNAIVERHPDKYRRASFGHCTYSFTPDIRKSFNRGFTTYFADGRKPGLVSFDTPKAMGEPVGKVKEIRGHSFNVAGTASFTNGDGLCFLDSNRQLVGFRVNKVEGNRIFPLRLPASLKPGTLLFRNYDQAFTSTLAHNTSERKIAVSLTLSEDTDTLILEAKDECGRTTVSRVSCELSPAQKQQDENIKRQLSKFGGTIFDCKEIVNNTTSFIPSSILSTLRRDIVESLMQMPIPYYIYKEEEKATVAQALPEYAKPYFYNASNLTAKAFYAEQGMQQATSMEKKSKNDTCDILMQCRYCLRNEMGYCTKSGKRAPWKEPLRLCLPDGKEFMLQFDCKNCQMNVSLVHSS